MSGPTDLARLTVTIDTANELLLSEEIKMMDVGGGVMRPTNAMVMTNLATQLGGAMPYTSVEEGLNATVGGTNFSVLSSAEDEYVNVYRNVAGAAVFVDSYPNAKSSRLTSQKADSVLNLSMARAYTDKMPQAILDELLRPILGVKANGFAYALLDELPGGACLGEWRWAIVDQDWFVLFGIKWSGETYIWKFDPGVLPSSAMTYVEGADGAADVFVMVAGAPYQITSAGCSYSPAISAGEVRFLQRNGPVASVSVPLPVLGSIATFVRKFYHLISYGQSLAMGSGSAAETLQPQVANRLFTLNAGVRLSNQDGTLTAAMVAPFKPMTAATTETPCVQMAGQLNRIRGLPDDGAMLVSCHGRGGYTIDQLSKGTLCYSNMMTAISAAKAECDRLGYEYEVPFMHFRQGEADRASAAGVYYSKLLQLQSDFESDVNAILGKTTRRPLLIEQLSNITSYPDYTTSEVIFDQLRAAQDFPELFVLCGPGYAIEHGADGTHMLAPGYQMLGCQNAQAAAGVLRGGRFIPTSARSAVLTGNKVLIDFNTPFPPLVLDEVSVLNPGNYGFRWYDSGNSASVASVRLIGPSTVEVTLSTVPTGSDAFLGIADIGTAGAWGGPRTGMRSNLRDSSPDVDSFGKPIRNWACHQRIAVASI